MRLKELKCKNCGASIKVDKNSSQVKCDFCNTEFTVEDAYHEGYKFEKGRMKAQDERLEQKTEQVKGILGPLGKAFALQYVITAVISAVVFIAIVIMIIFFVTRQANTVDEFELNRFNSVYEMYTGTGYGSSVGRLIDEVSTNNKKDKEHKITIKYNDVSTQEPDEMLEIKKQLDDWTKYEVIFEYDEDGFIYQAIIDE